MNPFRDRAVRLRIAGKSYNEIRKEVPVAKSTLSLWLRDLVLSDKANARLKARVRLGVTDAFLKRNKMQTVHAERRARNAAREGRTVVPKFSKANLLFAGALLYWAEGYKRLKVVDGKARMCHTISFVNSDPEMIRVFLRFLREVMEIPVEKIRLVMRLYPHINEAEALRYWASITRLPKERFFKSSYLITGASKGIRPYNRLPWGTLQIQVNDTPKFHYLMGMIEGVKEGY
ncbi:MAG: hypothetical protein WDN10_01935 [bacterium]